MGDQLLELVRTVMLSPWLYALIVGLAVADVFLPLVPSEAAVLLAGTYAAIDGPDLGLVVLAGAAGALLGDHAAYAAGRGLGVKVLSRARPGTRRHSMVLWATDATARRGGPVLVAARFMPGGRTAMTVTMGATRFPFRRFAGYDVVACALWASYTAGVGYVGGRLFSEHPLVGVLTGMGLALAVATTAEVVSRRRARRRVGADVEGGAEPQPERDISPAA